MPFSAWKNLGGLQPRAPGPLQVELELGTPSLEPSSSLDTLFSLKWYPDRSWRLTAFPVSSPQLEVTGTF